MSAGRLVLLAVLVAFALPLVQGANDCDDPGDFLLVPELGEACRTQHGWLVRVDPDLTLLTHGLDPHPPSRSPRRRAGAGRARASGA